MRTEDFIMMPIPSHQFTAVCALLGGASLAAVASAAPVSGRSAAEQTREPAPEPQGTATTASGADNAVPSDPVASDTGELDTGGHPWSADLHASTKNKTKDGYWRMKVGVSRPADKPGFPQAAGASTGATGTSATGTASEAGASASGGNAGPATTNDAVEDEDEFAAFRAAADRATATDTAAAAAVPARKWTDSDLGSLCNQAAQKLNNPDPVKTLIGNFVPEGQVAHSRNIPEARREEFAQAVEKAAGITFAG